MPDPASQEEFVRLLTTEQSAIHSFITSLMPGDPSVGDIAIYPGILTPQQVTDLCSQAVTPLDLLATFAPPAPIQIISVDYNPVTDEVTVVFATERKKGRSTIRRASKASDLFSPSQNPFGGLRI